MLFFFYWCKKYGVSLHDLKQNLFSLPRDPRFRAHTGRPHYTSIAFQFRNFSSHFRYHLGHPGRIGEECWALLQKERPARQV